MNIIKSKITKAKNFSINAIIVFFVLVSSQNFIIANAADRNPALMNSILPYYAPEIVGIKKWLNSDALKISDLKGKVVLVDFWTYSCINCLRTLPHMNELNQKYRDKGLVIIGVHAPEFDFEKNPQNVVTALRKFKIEYPVALDNDLKTWKNYHNQYWPAHYLINKEGKVVYTHFGEGAYDVMENNVRVLLGLDKQKIEKKDQQNYSRIQSPETYLGTERGERNINETSENFVFPKEIPTHHWALQGSWKVADQFVESKKAGDSLKFNFVAKKVFLVMASADGEEAKAKIFVNGKQKDFGKDVKSGVVKVKNSELYEIVNLSQGGSAVVEIKAEKAGLRAYAFTFGS